MKNEKSSYTGYAVYTRRQAIDLMTRLGAGAAAASIAVQSLRWFTPHADAAVKFPVAPKQKAMFYTKLGDGKVRCELCPRMITIPPGSLCFCRTRKNIGGELFALGFQRPCIVNFDPVERGPLYHFLPGTQTMTLASAGCNMNCLYCQNYELAQSSPEDVKSLDFNAEKALSEAQVKSLTLTYTEPACQPEYVFDLSKTARKLKLPVVMCTAGYINSEPLKQIIPCVDAFAVTLKAATDEDYLKLTEVYLKPVLQSIRQIKDSGKWLEIITLIVPGYNDTREGVRKIAEWIRNNVGIEIPWHLSRFTPSYRLKKIPQTPLKTMEEARNEGLKAGLKYVYITNLSPHEGNHTYCPKCNAKIIERLAFKTTDIHMKNGKCSACGNLIPGIWK